MYSNINLLVMTDNFVANYLALKRYSQSFKIYQTEARMTRGFLADEGAAFMYFAEETSV